MSLIVCCTNRETIRLRQMIDNSGTTFASFKSSETATEAKIRVQPGLLRLRQYARFSNELIPISKEDQREMKIQANGGEHRRNKVGISLIGFRKRESIPFFHTTAANYLIYPNEETVHGSRKAFSHLHAAMQRKKVVAIAEVLHRTVWTSRLVAIFPDDESTGTPKKPPGMLVMTLPFEDDMRSLEADEAIKWKNLQGSVKMEPGSPKPDAVESTDSCNIIASEDLINAAMNLMARQQLRGMELGQDFENAALVEFFNYLESVALELPVSSETEEFDTRLDDETVLQAAKAQIDAFQALLPEELKPQKQGQRKRKQAAKAEDDSGVDWEGLYRSDSLNDCKVPELKTYLRSVGEPVSGNKAALVVRVNKHLRKKFDGSVKVET